MRNKHLPRNATSISKLEIHLAKYLPQDESVTLFSEFSQTQTPPIFMEDKEHPPSFVIGYDTQARQEYRKYFIPLLCFKNVHFIYIV